MGLIMRTGLNFLLLAETPFGILDSWDSGITSSNSSFVKELGLPQLGTSFMLLGIYAALCIGLGTLVVFSIVQNPRLVSMTKTKMVAIFLIVAVIAALPFLFDVMGGIVNTSILSGG